MEYINNPQEIEKRSFEIITEELGRPLPKEVAEIVKRIIHTTA
ncbi:MAG: precorrin-8X methylmutase, partial [Eubacterium sp.]